jgi:hypothetical protein
MKAVKKEKVWKKAGTNSGTKTDRTWNPETEKTLEGIYMEMKDIKTKEGKQVKLYVIKEADGKLAAAWGAAMLDRLMQDPAIGDEVKITFVEKTFNKESGRYLKVFTVDYCSAEEGTKGDDVTSNDKPEDDIPF